MARPSKDGGPCRVPVKVGGEVLEEDSAANENSEPGRKNKTIMMG